MDIFSKTIYIVVTDVANDVTFSRKSVKTRVVIILEPPRGKTNNVVFERVRHKPACTSTEKSKKLEISDLSRRGVVLSE